jgi:membrane protease YdiL (CAAX protease family)
MNPAPGAPFPTLFQAVGLTLGASVLRALLLTLVAPELGWHPAFAGMATIAAFGATIALVAPRLPDPPGPHFGFVRASVWAWLAVPFLASSIVLVSELDNLARLLVPEPESVPPAEARDALAWLELGLVLAVVVPVCEEIFFRGLVQPGLARQTRAAVAVAVTAVLQGLAWALPYAFSPAHSLRFFTLYAGMALALGLLRAAGRSILPPLALSVLFGAIGVLAAAKVLGIPGFDDTGPAHTPLEWLAPAAFLTGIGLGLCRVAARAAESTSTP